MIGISNLFLHGFSIIAQYVYYTDGINIVRKGVRSDSFVVDITLDEIGFNGTEGVNWINIKTVS